MAYLHSLPAELIHIVGGFLTNLGDRAAFAATNRRMYAIVNPMLYKLMARTCGKRAIFYGASAGLLQTVKKSLDAGVEPDWGWNSDRGGAELGELMLKVTITPQDPQDPESDGTVEMRHCADVWLDEHFITNRIDPDLELEDLSVWMDHTQYRSCNWTALHVAAYKGYDDIVSAILDSRETPASLINKYSQGVCSCKLPGTLKTLSYDRSSEDYPNPFWSSLHYAICSGHISTAKLLLSRGASVQISYNSQGTTALHAACQYGLLHLAEFIVDNGYQTNLNEVDEAGQTALVYAFLYRQWDCFDWLLERGADIHYPPEKNFARSMLNDACLDLDFEATYRVIDYGLELDNKSLEHQQNPLHIILQGPWDPNLVHKNSDEYKLAEARGAFGTRLLPKLLNKRSLIDDVDPIFGSTPLALAARYRIVPAVRALLAAGADVDACGDEGMTPLYEACKVDHHLANSEVVALLLQHGALVDKPDDYDRTPLYIACHSPREAYLETTNTIILLLDHGADPLARCPDDSPLTKALIKGMLSVSSILVSKLDRKRLDQAEFHHIFYGLIESHHTEQPAFQFLLGLDTENLISQNPRCMFLLMIHTSAARNAIHLMLDRGASCTYVSESQFTVLHYAITYKRGVDIVQRLLNGGADPNFANRDGVCPLMCAQRWDGNEYAYGRLLLQHGADIHQLLDRPSDTSIQNASDELLTPLIWAIIQQDIGSRDAVQVMLEYQPFRDRPDAPSSATVLAAVKTGHVQALRAMIESGIDIHHISDNNADNLLLALLEEIPKKVNSYYRETRPAEIFETVGEWVDIMEILVEHGARWAATNDGGPSALQGLEELMSLEKKSAHGTSVAYHLLCRLEVSRDSSHTHRMVTFKGC